MAVQWARRRASREELGRVWETDKRTKLLYSCESSLMVWPTCYKPLTVLQWRVRLWQDDSPVTPPFIIPLVLFNASLIQVITRSLRVRHSNNHQIRNNTNSFESWPLLRASI